MAKITGFNGIDIWIYKQILTYLLFIENILKRISIVKMLWKYEYVVNLRKMASNAYNILTKNMSYIVI